MAGCADVVLCWRQLLLQQWWLWELVCLPHKARGQAVGIWRALEAAAMQHRQQWRSYAAAAAASALLWQPIKAADVVESVRNSSTQLPLLRDSG